jgi:hypothetical protein
MVINGRDIKFLVDVEANCSSLEFKQAHPEMCEDRITMYAEVFANQGWHRNHPEDKAPELTVEEVSKLDLGPFVQLSTEYWKERDRSMKTTVHVEEKPKNAKSAAKK